MTASLLENPRQSLFKVGTLTYTKAGLAALMAWFVGVHISMSFSGATGAWFTLFLRDSGINNREIMVLCSTLGMIINTIFNPIISSVSDRTRTKWGRRRPFIIWSTPVVMVLGVLMPFVPEITKGLTAVGWIASLFDLVPVAPLVLMFGMLIVLRSFCGLFFATTYYYLIPDVVPSGHIGRLWSYFNITGQIHGLLFNWFLFPYILSHTKLLVIAGVTVYGTILLLMCWRVKEGEYPPVELKQEEKKPPWWDGIRRYVKECFGHPYYLLIFLTYGSMTWVNAGGALSIFFQRDELGLTLSNIGKMNAVLSLTPLPFLYFAGIYVDRLGSLRSMLIAKGTALLLIPLSFFFIQGAREIIIFAIVGAAPAALHAVAYPKFLIDVYPRDRYGQFCSAGAMVAAGGSIVLGLVCGWFIDKIQWYRCLLLWSTFFTLIMVTGLIIIRRQWKAYGGGTEHYSPP